MIKQLQALRFARWPNKRLRFRSWGFKLAASVGLLVATFVGILVYLSSQTQQGFVENRHLSEIDSMGRVVREVSLQYLIDDRPAELDIIYEEWSDRPNVVALEFIDEDNLLLITSESGGGNLFLSTVDDPIIAQAREQHARVIEMRENHTVAAFPVFVGTSFLGTVRIKYAYKSMNEEVDIILRQSLKLGAIFTVIGLALSVWLATMLTAPLRALNEASLKAADGDLSQTIAAHSDDEIGSLANSFNKMLVKLHERVDALESTKKDLGESRSQLEGQNQLLRVTLEEAEHAKRRAETAEVAKSQFVARMSHEIRTPLNGVLGMTELLGETSLSSEQGDLLETIHKSGDSLLAVVNDILDFSKIESGHMALRTDVVDIDSLLDGTIQTLAPQASKSGIEFVASLSPHVPSHVLGDGVRLKQILMNLAGNAIKFTKEGHVRISVSVARSDTGADLLTFDVEDSGCGIQEDKLSTLFDEFTQVDGSHSRAHQGTGLGLAISRGFVQLMNGDIWVRSKVGSGTTFSFSVPLATPKALPEGTSDLRPDLTTHIVCLAVRSDVLAESLSTRLNIWNAQTHTVTEANLPAFLTRPPKQGASLTVVTDAVIARRFASELKLWKQTYGGTVLALTELREAKTLAKTALEGVDKTVLKPLSVKKLSELFVRPPSGPKTAKAVSTPQPRLSVSEKRVLVVDDNATNRKIVELLLKREGVEFLSAVDGRDAVEKFKQFQPDIVLMDVSMPVMDGYQATRAIREMEQASPENACQIVGLTAHSTSDDRTACLQSGMNRHISKPVKMDVLRDLISR